MTDIQKIWEWRYRECFSTDNPDLCVKKMKDRITRKLFWIQISIKSELFSLIKFWNDNINIIEYEVIKKLPKELLEYFPRIIYLENWVLYMERPRNYDWTYSITLQEHGPTDNEAFWEHIEKIERICRDNKFRLFDILRMWKNILIQKISETEFKPVIIDCKRTENWSKLTQPNLLLNSERRKKFYRRLARFMKDFRLLEIED